ncbi:MAG: hypothetical protein NTU41_03055, partial [Chloroflexi bacterium]|nr:hypothetical protein [Chloroflexota bacterium]
MTAIRRIPRALWRYSVLNVILVVVITSTSVLGSVSPARAAAAPVTVEDKATASSDDTAQLKKVSVRATPDADVDLRSENGKISLHIPKGATNEEADIEMTELGQWGPREAGMLDVFEFHAFAGKADKRTEIHQFNKGLTLSVQYGDKELQGIDLDTMQLCYLDDKTGIWAPVSEYHFDRESRTMTGTLEHFTNVGIRGNPLYLGPGRVMAFQVGLSSGTAIASYPIEVPPGSGGFQPSIQLVYNSASVDAMHSKKSVGSWVGIGWSLSLGSISRDPNTNEYFLNLGGQSYKLVYDNAGAYHTVPESFYKVTQGGWQWDLYDREGRHYQFGSTSDSRQYYDTSTYYRWDLNCMQDVNPGNSVTVHYVQDTWTDANNKTHVRAAYPDHVYYNNSLVDICFNSTYDSSGGNGPLRVDSPTSPLPKIVETRRLNSIETKVSGTTVRRYVFGYNMATPGDPTVAGRLELGYVQEYDGLGNSLPALDFGYGSGELTIYHYENDQGSNPDPGNPAILTWPYLTTVSNGYAATTTYSYLAD